MANNRQKKVFNLFIVFSAIVICGVIFAAPILSRLVEKQFRVYAKNIKNMDVFFEDIQVKILPPKLVLKNLELTGKKDSALKSFKTEEVEIIPKLGPSFLGEINIKSVKINEPVVILRQVNSMRQKKSKKTSFELPQLKDLISLTVENVDWGRAKVVMELKEESISCVLFDSEISFLASTKNNVFKLKSKAALSVNDKELDVDYLQLNLDRTNDKVELSSFSFLSSAASIQAEGVLLPQPEISYTGVTDLHQLMQLLSSLSHTKSNGDIYGKLNYKGSFSNSWSEPIIKAQINSSSLDLAQRNIRSLQSNIEVSKNKIDTMDARFFLGKGSVRINAKNITQSDRGQVSIKVNHLPVKNFIHAIDPKVISPIKGSVDIESSGTLSFNPDNISIDTKLDSKKLEIVLEPEVKRFAPIVFKNVKLSSVLKSSKEKVLMIDEGELIAKGIKGKFSLDILKKGGVEGQWLGEIQDFSGIFVNPYPVQGKGRFLGGIKASKNKFIANVDVDLDSFSYGQSKPAKLKGDIIFRNKAISFKDIIIKNESSVLNAQVETSELELKNNFVKASFKGFELSLISQIASRAYPFIKSFAGIGDGEIYINTEDQINGKIKLKADNLNYKSLAFDKAALNVAIKNSQYVFEEATFIGNQAKLLISGKISKTSLNNLNIEATGLEIGSLGAPSWLDIYFDTLSGSINIDGDINDPKVRSDLELTPEQQLIDGLNGYSGLINVSGTLNDLNWRLNVGQNNLVSEGKFNFDSKILTAEATLDEFMVLPIYKTFPTTLSSQIIFSGNIDDPSSQFGKVDIKKLLIQRQAEAIYNQKPFSVDINQGIIKIPSVNFVDNKKTDLNLFGSISPSYVDIALKGDVDMQNLLIMNVGLERSEGLGNVNLIMNGNPDAINYQGDVTINDAFIKLDSFPHPFEKLSVRGELQQNILFVNELKSSLGGGDLSLFGQINIQPKFLNSTVNLQGRGDRVSLRFPTWMPVEVSGSVFLQGPMYAPTLGGDFTVLNGQYEDKWDWQSRVLTFGAQKYIDRVYYDEDISMYFDMNFKTTPNTFRLSNNIAQGLLSGDVRLVGNNQKLGLLGSIEITNGEVEFLDNIFELENGAITFTDQNKIDPKFDLRATTTVAQKNIILDITSEGDDIVALLSSSPFLDETSIVTLLTVGVEADEFLNSGGQANRLSSSFLPSVLSSPIQSKLEKGLREVNVVDTLQFIPYFSEEQQSTGLRILIGKQIFPRFRVLYSTDLLQTNSERNLRLQQNFSRNLAIQGNIRDNNNSVANDEQIDFGLDFEFRFDF